MALSPSKTKPFIVPVFIPHAGCPHQCVFCNQHSATGQIESLPSANAIRKTIEKFLTYRRDSDRWTEISFFGGTFLGLPPVLIRLLLATATPFVRQGLANGIRFSTRPDSIDAEHLALIAPFPVTTIELGVQSMNDEVLQRSHRGHTAQDTLDALTLLKTQPYAIGVQLMVGLPGDTAASALASARQLATLAPDFVRIYPTLVLKGSPLAHRHAQGQYDPLPLDEAVALTAELYRIFARHAIPVIRMGLQATAELSPQADLIAGPFHPAFGELVQSSLWQDAIARHLEAQGLLNSDVTLQLHPRLLSQVKGQQDANIIGLIERCGLRSLEVLLLDTMADDRVHINGKPCWR